MNTSGQKLNIKIENFEGPFDLLFHLVEKNKMNIYDICINEITDQYMDYLYKMQSFALDVASEFIVMASTLIHIKSRLLLPTKNDSEEKEEIDTKEELVFRLIEYKKYKESSKILKLNEEKWSKVYYKLPESIEFEMEEPVLDLSINELKKVYLNILNRNKSKINKNTHKMSTIIEHEKVSLKGKIRDVLKALINKTYVKFTEIFPSKSKTKLEVITGFLAILELAKLKKINIVQDKPYEEIILLRTDAYDDENNSKQKSLLS